MIKGNAVPNFITFPPSENCISLKFVYFLKRFDPFVILPSLSHWKNALMISANPKVAIAR